MITKILEVRDRATFIPVVVVQMFPHEGEDNPYTSPSTDNVNFDHNNAVQYERQRYLLRRVGYPCDDPVNAQYVLFRANGDGYAYSDPITWGDRTMQVAHLYIRNNFDTLSDGDVVDVEFILGESAAPKVSERGD